jgi:hypothetical protein
MTEQELERVILVLLWRGDWPQEIKPQLRAAIPYVIKYLRDYDKFKGEEDK